MASEFTEGNDFEIGVAVPIINSRFLFPTLLQSQFNAANNANSTSIVLPDGASSLDSNSTINAKDSSNSLINPTYLQLYAKADDTVKFGPSSDTDNSDSGSSERTTIDSVDNAYTFSIGSNPSYYYDAGDNVEIRCSKFPASWYFNVRETNVSSTDRVRGRLTNYAFQMQRDGTATDDDGTTSASYFHQDLDSSYLYATKYRTGFWIKGDTSTTSGTNFTGVHVNDGSTNFINQGYDVDDISSSTWEMKTTTGTASSGSSFYIHYWLGHNWTTGTDTINLDEVFLEHSYIPTAGYTVGTAYGDSTITDNGYFVFSDPDNFTSYNDYTAIKPDLGSVQIEKYDSTTQLRLINGSVKQYDPSGLGQRVDKYTFSCSFTNVQKGFFEVLREYLKVQKDGYLLNFHPYLEILPSTLTGFMTLSNIQYSEWDADLVSFDFSFQEY